MGVNFIDKSVFITLNGVLARVITDTELNGNSDGDKTSTIITIIVTIAMIIITTRLVLLTMEKLMRRQCIL